MMRGTDGFLSANDRPKKRELQTKQYKIVGDWLGTDKINVVDMPSLYTTLSLEMMNAAGININHYWAIEYEKEIATSIARELSLHLPHNENTSSGQRLQNFTVTGARDILEVLGTSRTSRRIDFYNLDFCGAMGPSWRAFSLPHCLSRACNDKFAVCLTFNPRSPSKPVRKVKHALSVIAPEFYGLVPLEIHKYTYRDTSAMTSWLALYRKET